MSPELAFSFGPQERRKGEDLYKKGLVSVSGASDANVNAFVKGSSACRVSLNAEEIASPKMACNCTCPQARKGELCKHVWAVLLKLDETGSDFLEGKVEAIGPGATNSPIGAARSAKAEEYKAAQKQKLKDRNKEKRDLKKRQERGPQLTYPEPVQESLDFFAANGFPLEEFDLTTLQNARKVLARVFHPDKGGSHDEILKLNEHYDCLEAYLES